MRKRIIEFIDITNNIPESLYPSPASREIPDWYKKSLNHNDGKKEVYADDRGFVSSTIKKCIPVFDAITSGYIIKTDCDIQITKTAEGYDYFKWSKTGRDIIGFQARAQMQHHHMANKNGADSPKWNNPWSIKTPKGYSTLFIPPMHRNNIIQILEGVVDTDSYVNPVQFPFAITDEDFQGIIPAGTPIAQIIPIKREAFSHAVKPASMGGDAEIEKVRASIFSTFFNGYKDRFWTRKQYN